MANIDKIKEQGNQAAPLLTELQHNESQNELVISCFTFTGTIQSLQIDKLRGRQNIIRFLDKYKKGEIKVEDIKLKFVEVSDIQSKVSIPIDMEIAKWPNDSLTFRIIKSGIAGLNESAIIEFSYGNDSGDYLLSVEAYPISNKNDIHTVTAEFAD